MSDVAYRNWLALQERIERPARRRDWCPHPDTYISKSWIRDYPDGERIYLPEFIVCRRCYSATPTGEGK